MVSLELSASDSLIALKSTVLGQSVKLLHDFVRTAAGFYPDFRLNPGIYEMIVPDCFAVELLTICKIAAHGL